MLWLFGVFGGCELILGFFFSISVKNVIGVLIRIALRDFPGGTVVKNPPANAGDTGSNPGSGKSHMSWSN